MSRIAAREVHYPESDGKPMAETDVHRDWMVRHIERLRRRYRGQRVYVSGNLLIYYVEGDPKKSFAPDTFVVFECSREDRRTFKIWEEGKAPNFILETTSKKTRRQDSGPKKELSAQLRVPEYFLYDPLGEWLKPPLQGFRLVNDQYERIAPLPDGSIVSDVLGVRLLLEDGELVMFDLATGARVLSDAELTEEAERREAEAERREAEAQRRETEAQRREAEAERQRDEE